MAVLVICDRLHRGHRRRHDRESNRRGELLQNDRNRVRYLQDRIFSPSGKTGTGYMFNPAAFSIPQPGAYGNLVRNALRGPSFFQIDATLSKTFLTERKTLE